MISRQSTYYCFFFVLFLFTKSLPAQHPLVGTWEMVSMQGIGADGERFSYDSTQVREIKIITPGHYMLMAFDVDGDSLMFNRTYAGAFTVEGNRYIETPLYSSLPIFDNVKSNFIWELEGDRFIQSGTVTRPDGKTVLLEALVFKRLTVKHDYKDNPAIGAWDQLSSHYTDYDGGKFSHTRETTRRFHLITPTHWARFSSKDGKFQHAMIGTYQMRNGLTYPNVEYASFAAGGVNVEMKESIHDNKLNVSGSMKSSEGKTFTWNDVFERIE